MGGLEFVVSCPHVTFYFCLDVFFGGHFGPAGSELGFGSEHISGRTFASPAAANVAKPTVVVLFAEDLLSFWRALPKRKKEKRKKMFWPKSTFSAQLLLDL